MSDDSSGLLQHASDMFQLNLFQSAVRYVFILYGLTYIVYDLNRLHHAAKSRKGNDGDGRLAALQLFDQLNAVPRAPGSSRQAQHWVQRHL